MATGWLRGIVKEVPTGDTIVIVGTSKAEVPPEKRITLSSLVAPRLGKRDGSSSDEPFAWQSREFLRIKLIGKAVVFRVDYIVEQIANRQFGSVFLDQESVALVVVTNGWAKVRGGGGQQSPQYQDLLQAEAAAKDAGVGLWSEESDAVHPAARALIPEEDFDAVDFLAKVGKGKPVPGIVEQVLNGSTLRVCLLPDYRFAVVSVCGILAPNMGKRPQTYSNGTASAAEALSTTAAEPLAREAKWFTEQRVLNREVRVVAEGIDRHNHVLASVFYPCAEQPVDLAEQLVQKGLAKTAEWSLAYLSNSSQRLRELERAAKEAQLGVWANYVPKQTAHTKMKDNFMGKVLEVVSGDCLVIKDAATGMERRINLSSVRAPRMGTRERVAEPWGIEAREYLRKQLIGQEVSVQMEYSRKVPVLSDVGVPTNEVERVLAFGYVGMVGDKHVDTPSIAEMVVEAGYATVIKHRADEERSKVYAELMEAENAAKAARRGLHGSRDPPPHRINDISIPGNVAKARQHLPFLKRAGKLPGVVEHVMSGHRLKVHIPKEGVSIAFAPLGIKCPQRAMPAQNGRPPQKAEPYAWEALCFTREVMMQRDVEVQVDAVDRVGTFLGTITIPGPKPLSLPMLLLRAGLARLQPHFDPASLPGGHDLVREAEAAKKANIKIWEHYAADEDCEVDQEPAASSCHSSAASAVDTVESAPQDCSVTEVTDGNHFFVQLTTEARLEWLSQQLSSLTLADTRRDASVLQGQLCLARFTLDDQWYRAYVEKVYGNAPTCDVYFIDFGNKECVASERIASLSSALAALPAQAQPCGLAGVQLPSPKSDWYAEAHAYFSKLVSGGRGLKLQIVSKEAPSKEPHPMKKKGKWAVILMEPGGSISINAMMVAAGMARALNPHKICNLAVKAVAYSMQEFEEQARKFHKGMFQYGDPGDSDDEEMTLAPRRK